MKILITNNHLVRHGGTERWVESMANELDSMKHNVHVFAIDFGGFANECLSKYMVKCPDTEYDLILVNHNTCLRYLNGFGIKGKRVFTSHGYFHPLERPEHGADIYVSVSEETRSRQTETTGIDSIVIMNGINHLEFRPRLTGNYGLIACKGNMALVTVSRIFSRIGLRSLIVGQSGRKISEEMGAARVVVGIGRTAMEASMCDVGVVIYDSRDYCGETFGGVMCPLHEDQRAYNFTGREKVSQISEWSITHAVEKAMAYSGSRMEMIDSGLTVSDVAKKYLALY